MIGHMEPSAATLVILTAKFLQASLINSAGALPIFPAP
jgi:hypothetical protein